MYKTILFMQRFCVDNILIQDSELLSDAEYRSLKGRLFLQMIFTHMYCHNYIISSEYFNYYVHLMTMKNFRGYYLIDDELQQMSNYDDDHDSYLHPSDLFNVDIPKFWLKLFHAEDIYGTIQINFIIPGVQENFILCSYMVGDRIDSCVKLDPESQKNGSIDIGGSYKPP